MPQITIQTHQTIQDIPRDAFISLFPDREHVWDYHAAAERMTSRAFRFGAIAAYAHGRLVAAAPMFRVDYRVDGPLAAPFQAIGDWLEEVAPSWITMPMLGLGSPISDECEIGFQPSLDDRARDEVFQAMIEGMSRQAEANDIRVLLLKDVPDGDDCFVHPTMIEQKFSRIPSLPVATLDLPYASLDGYLASLPPKVRQDMRRKLRQSADVRIEYRTSIEGISDTIVDLYRQTRAHRKASYYVFDELPGGYFKEVMEGLDGRARMQLLWAGDRLACFSLFIVERARLLGRYLGMDYSLARKNNLYFVNWMAMVSYAIANGIPQMQVGQSAYGTKVKLGCTLRRSWIYVKHTGVIRGPMFRMLSPYAAFDRMDPDLASLGSNAPYA